MIYRDERVTQPYMTRVYLAPERNSGSQKTAAALVYLAEILGGSGATSVLGKALQFEAKKALYTSAYYGGMSLDKTTFGLVVVPSAEVSLQEVEDLMDTTIAEFIQQGVNLEAFERIKSQLRASEIYAKDNVQGIANQYGSGLTQGLSVQDVQAWPEVLQEVTPADIIAAAEMVFDDKSSVTGWLMGMQEDVK